MESIGFRYCWDRHLDDNLARLSMFQILAEFCMYTISNPWNGWLEAGSKGMEIGISVKSRF